MANKKFDWYRFKWVQATETVRRLEMPTEQLPVGTEAPLPTSQVATHEMSDVEIAEEARDGRKLIRQFGFYDSAMLHMTTLHHQYVRTCEATGRLSIGSTLKAVGLSIPVALALVVLTALLPLSGGGLDAVEGVDGPFWSLSRIIVMGMGGIGGGGVAMVILAIILRIGTEWSVAYADARIAQRQRNSDGSTGDTIALLETPMLRLGFLDRYGESLFSGSDDHSGFADGRLALETFLDVATCHDDELYTAGACWKPKSGNTGLNASSRRDGYRTAEHAGELRALHGMPDNAGGHGLGEWLSAHQLLVLMGGAVGLAVVLLLLGIENQSFTEVIREHL